jgi:hypothetical protein
MKKVLFLSFLLLSLIKGICQNPLSLGKLKMGMNIEEIYSILAKDSIPNDFNFEKIFRKNLGSTPIPEGFSPDINIIKSTNKELNNTRLQIRYMKINNNISVKYLTLYFFNKQLYKIEIPNSFLLEKLLYKKYGEPFISEKIELYKTYINDCGIKMRDSILYRNYTYQVTPYNYTLIEKESELIKPSGTYTNDSKSIIFSNIEIENYIKKESLILLEKEMRKREKELFDKNKDF